MCICVYLRKKNLMGWEGVKDTTEGLICLTDRELLPVSFPQKQEQFVL